MERGVFVGAFELYYNISRRKEAMDSLISRTNTMIYGLSATLLFVVLASALGIHWGMRQRKRYETTLVTLATKDSLTGVYNRRRFLELLSWEVEKHNRYRHEASLLLFDLDHFKVVNDTHGHQVGDEVLISIVDKCQTVIRKSDLMARYGGEEFIVLLPEADKATAVTLAERIRSTVEETSIPYYGGDINVTVSVGVASFKQVDPLTVDNVIKLADDCLFQSKESGRNTVSSCGP